MPTTLTYGTKVPTTGERGTWWTNLADGLIKLDSHQHNGVNSAKIPTANLDKNTTDILAASWVAVAGQSGTFRQLITTPAGITFPKVAVTFLVNGGAEDGFPLMLSVEKVTASTYYVYINDNTLALKAVYA